MKMIYQLILIFACIISINGYAVSPEAMDGKDLYPSCHVCHNQAMDPPMGPPMWGVQRRYKKSFPTKESFVKRMAKFVKTPTLETAIHDEALSQLGLMPAMPLPDEMLEKIATYIFEEQFSPPCDHWRIAVRRAEEKGDLEHAQKDQRQINRFCN